MTQIKLEVGKQYKTRGCWRCVVVDKKNTGDFYVWHSNDIMYTHNIDGQVGYTESDYNIISEWVEPKTVDVWVALYKNVPSGNGYYSVSSVKKQDTAIPEDMLARKKITITEGEFDE